MCVASETKPRYSDQMNGEAAIAIHVEREAKAKPQEPTFW
jgi:hypothetical protein